MHNAQEDETTHSKCDRLMFFLCSNIARMGQQTCEMHAAMRAITRRFLCDNVARMGLPHTTNMRDACCPIFARHADAATFSLYQHCKDGLTKHNKNARCIDDRLNVFLCSNIARMG